MTGHMAHNVTLAHLNAVAQGWAFREFDGRCRGFEPADYSSKASGDAAFALDDQAEAHAVFERAAAMWRVGIPGQEIGYRWAMAQGHRSYHKERFLMGGEHDDAVREWARWMADIGYFSYDPQPELRRFMRILRHVIGVHIRYRVAS